MEVGTRNPRFIRIMDDEGAVSEEGAEALLGGGEVVEVGGVEGVGGDLAVLAGEVADLAGLGEELVAGGGFAADEGVEVCEGCGAVAVGGNGEGVEVIDCGLVRLGFSRGKDSRVNERVTYGKDRRR